MKKILLLVIVGILGCGSNPSNDQGVSFSLDRFCADAACGTPITGADISLDGIDGAAGLVIRGELKNFLLAQSMRVKGAKLEYSIIGGNIPTLYDTFTLGATLAPATAIAAGGGVNPTNPTTPTTPAATTGNASTTTANSTTTTKSLFRASTPSVGIVSFPVLTPNIKKTISLQRNDLPDTPFSMIVTVRFVGLTTSGDEYITNPLDLSVIVTTEPDPAPITDTDGGTNAGNATSDGATTDATVTE